MPVFNNPRQAIITEGSSTGEALALLALLAVPLLVIISLVAFVLAHLVLLAVCAAVFIAVMGTVIAAMRWAASPRRLRQQHYLRPAVRVPAARPAQALSVRRPLAIAAPREVHLHITLTAEEFGAIIRRELP